PRGYSHQASIGALAARAHVSRATIYHHFVDKQDILVALADRSARRITQAADAWEPLPRGPSRAEGGPGYASMESQLRQMIETRIAKILNVISANADAVRLLVQLARGDDRRPDPAARRPRGHLVGI